MMTLKQICSSTLLLLYLGNENAHIEIAVTCIMCTYNKISKITISKEMFIVSGNNFFTFIMFFHFIKKTHIGKWNISGHNTENIDCNKI